MNKIMKTILSILLIPFLIIGVSCKKDKSISLEQDYKLKLGYTVTFNKEELQIHFDEVLEDSRCPIGPIDCFWAGRAVVKMIVTENGMESDYEFSTFAPVHMDTTLATGFGDYHLELKAINPYPDMFNSTSDEEYNVVFRLSEI